MSHEVALHADLSVIGITSLKTLMSLLSACTIDDIQPLALYQAEKLGTLLPFNGEFAEMMPDLLQKSSSHRIACMQLLVGWQKNDAPAYLAKTAGGQSIALLMACINDSMPNFVGEILHGLCSRMLQREFNIVSLLPHVSLRLQR